LATVPSSFKARGWAGSSNFLKTFSFVELAEFTAFSQLARKTYKKAIWV